MGLVKTAGLVSVVLVAAIAAGIGYISTQLPTREAGFDATVPLDMFAALATSAGVVQVKSVPTPTPPEGSVLVRFFAAPINPSDVIHATTHGYDKDPFPHRLGFEGAGLVVKSGGGAFADWLVGRRVAAASTAGGTWAQYGVFKATEVLMLPDDVTYEEGASSFVNPLTVMAMLDIANKGGHKTVLQTAAASQLGQQLVRMGRRKGLTIINVVRRQEQANLLKEAGAEHILLSSDKDFESKLQAITAKMDCRLAFDPIGGDSTGILLRALPRSSELYIFADLSKENITGLRAETILREDKSIKPLMLNKWIERAGPVSVIGGFWTVMTSLKTDLRTSYSQHYAIRDTPCAYHRYTTQPKTSGKPLIQPNNITDVEIVC